MPDNVNIVTIIISCLFVTPIVVGIVRPHTGDRIYRSFSSLVSNLILLASVILSIYFTRVILYDGDNFILSNLYEVFPALQNAVEDQQIWVYFVFFTVLTLLINGILHLLTWPIYRFAVMPISGKIASAVDSMNGFARKTIGGLWQIPKAICLVLFFSIMLNFYTGFFNTPRITEDADSSEPYQFIQETVIQPLLNSSTVKDIQVILNDSFKYAEDQITDGNGKIQLIKYFNGVTLSEAVKSSSEIDAAAKQIVGSETDEKQKAYLIYIWICENIKYDNDKAAALADNPSDVSSGAIVAFTTKTGVCFDYSCLYVAMCRAVGLNVRFMTGLGFTGTVWGDHAWNQVYCESRWLNVDTTFGSSGVNYFDKSSFYLDHKDSVIQGEW